MRISRRDFMKYCAMSAAALGLTTTDLGKLEKALATDSSAGGTRVVWLNGAACTGCTVTFANSMFYNSVENLLVPWVAVNSLGVANSLPNGPLDIDFIETLSTAVGNRAIDAAQSAMNSGEPFVLCIEGAIQTASNGDFCTTGTDSATNAASILKFKDEVYDYAIATNCAAIIAVGTCASYGGIPAAKGSVTGARGLVSTGKISGGYQTTNTEGYWDLLNGTAVYGLDAIKMTNYGSGYTADPTITFTGGVVTTETFGFTRTPITSGGQILGVSVSGLGTGFTSTPTVTFSGGGGIGAAATATRKVTAGLSSSQWADIMGKTICVPGCPPHPDWIVGTIVYVLTYGSAPLMDKWHRPLDYYQEYQCTNCLWRTNKPGDAVLGTTHDIDGLGKASQSGRTLGNSPKLYKYKYDSQYEGCIGVMGCKGRKTKADCSYRRWNTNTTGSGGVSWCVQTRAGCHGCTDPRFPDGWGKFFSFV